MRLLLVLCLAGCARQPAREVTPPLPTSPLPTAAEPVPATPPQPDADRRVVLERRLVIAPDQGREQVCQTVVEGAAAKGLGRARLQFAASLTRRPGDVEHRLYIGGRVLDTEHRTVARFGPRAVRLTELAGRRTMELPSSDGRYLATVSLEPRGEGAGGVVLYVQIR